MPDMHDKQSWKLNTNLLEDSSTHFKIVEIIEDILVKLMTKKIKSASHALKL
ncbi:Hypothetical protein FKW44_009451, partial [Caligus rogercresseyi]